MMMRERSGAARRVVRARAGACAVWACLGLSAAAWTGCASGERRARGEGGSGGVGAASVAVADGAREAAFRAHGPREHATIFTALDWPGANEVRLGSGRPGPGYWQQRCDYEIEAELDTAERVLRCRGVLTYTNNSPHELEYVWLNLEQNLFRKESAGARMSKPGDRFGNAAGFDGGFNIGRVELVDHGLALFREDRAAGTGAGGAGGVGGTVPAARIMTAEESAMASAAIPLKLSVYDTLGRVELPSPIAARGGRVKIAMEWWFRIPDYGSDRMGIEKVSSGEVFQLAQWFPNMCVYDDVHGWNTMPYLGAGEFYTDFGDYRVSITAPREQVVVATGVLQNPEEVLTGEQVERLERARTTRQTVMVIDVDEAGSASTRPVGEGPLTWRFVAHNVRTFAFASSGVFIWDASSVLDDGGGCKTLCQSVYPREGRSTWKDSTDMLRFAIEGYNARWHEYPYPVATNVNGRVGGMEYPMIIFCSGRGSDRALYGVTTHEIGHNWFPMMVNTDERRHAWMDEGFNTFINYYSNIERFGAGDERRGDARRFARMNPKGTAQPIVTYPDQNKPGTLGLLQYDKPAVGLVLLREVILGHERFDAAFRGYVRDWAFKSPRPWDFFRYMEDAAGADLSWFWRGWFYETGVLDQAVSEVRHEVVEGAGFKGDVRVVIESPGELVMPVVMEVEYDDGTVERRELPVEVWVSTRRWETGWNTGGKRIRRVEVDPDGMMPDVDHTNDEWRG